MRVCVCVCSCVNIYVRITSNITNKHYSIHMHELNSQFIAHFNLLQEIMQKCTTNLFGLSKSSLTFPFPLQCGVTPHRGKAAINLDVDISYDGTNGNALKIDLRYYLRS